jgi:exosortase
MNQRHVLFSGLTILAGAFAVPPLWTLINSGRTDYYSHIVLIPVVSAYFFWVDRKKIFANPEPATGLGGALMALGALLYLLARYCKVGLGENDYASLTTFSSLCFCEGSFMFLYGLRAFRTALFPLLFLLFAVPLPWWLMERVIYMLQVASTEVVYWLFLLTDTPFQRNGFLFYLPGVTIEVAQQCSGIRSSMALFITGVLAGHLFLDRNWKTIVLFVVTFPITVFKNAIRIMTLTFLAMYVDMRFLTGGFLHQSGGFLFYIPALVLLGLAIWGLRRVGAKDR